MTTNTFWEPTGFHRYSAKPNPPLADKNVEANKRSDSNYYPKGLHLDLNLFPKRSAKPNPQLLRPDICKSFILTNRSDASLPTSYVKPTHSPVPDSPREALPVIEGGKSYQPKKNNSYLSMGTFGALLWAYSHLAQQVTHIEAPNFSELFPSIYQCATNISLAAKTCSIFKDVALLEAGAVETSTNLFGRALNTSTALVPKGFFAMHLSTNFSQAIESFTPATGISTNILG